jgi:hypothetical protein
MHIVNRKGIQTLVRKPEQEEPHWRVGRIMQMSVFERNRMGGLYCFVRAMVRVSRRFFCSLCSATKYADNEYCVYIFICRFRIS